MNHFARRVSLFTVFLMCTTIIGFAAPRDIQRHWAAVPINTLIENGVINGYPDGRFRPDHKITREEAAAILLALSQKSDHSIFTTGNGQQTAAPTFSDVGQRWSAEAIQALTNAKILNGFPDGTFRPGDVMTREEFAFMTYRYLEQMDQVKQAENNKEAKPQPSSEEEKSTEPGAQPSGEEEKSTEPGAQPPSEEEKSTEPGAQPPGEDGKGTEPGAQPPGEEEKSTEPGAQPSEKMKEDADSVPQKEPAPLPSTQFGDITGGYAMEAIQSLCSRGILSGYEDGRFHPDDPITRAEVSAVIYQISELPAVVPKVELPEKNVIEVPYHSQVYPVSALVGCEGTSLLMGLQSKGYALDIDLWNFLNNMPRHSSNPAKGFVGSPFKPDPSKRTRTTIYPAKLAEYGSLYGTATDISGSSTRELQAELLAGNPVVVYATLWWEKPFYRYYNIEGQRQRLLSNNHVVLVCGYDSASKSYYISDPYNLKDTRKEYKYWISASVFEPIYNERQQAVVIE